MAGVFEPLVAVTWGAALVDLGLMISVGGGGSLMDASVCRDPLTCGRDARVWRTTTARPVNQLWATNLLIQFFLILSFFSKSAYQFSFFIASVAISPSFFRAPTL